MGRGIFLLGRYCILINSLFGHGLWAVDKSVRIERTCVPPMYTKSACYWRSIPKLIFLKCNYSCIFYTQNIFLRLLLLFFLQKIIDFIRKSKYTRIKYV